ncbi:MAG TPA: glycosyltransferase family 10 [Candidatus Limnocylindrales bacterium]|nr:glycosyltransferase family 10 [Candidatus Limnocylindrales bacterium]
MINPTDIKLFIDPFSHHFQQDTLFDINKCRLDGDNILAPYVYLRNWFEDRGIEVHTADHLLQRQGLGAKNVYISFGIQDHYRTLARWPDVILSAFFAFEGPIVEPTLYLGLTKAQKYFKRIFSFSDAESLKPFLRGPLQCFKFHIPQSFESVHEEIWGQEDRKFLVMITANKLPRLYYQELYTERRRAVEYFSRTGEIDLYGVGWDGPAHRVGKTRVPYTFRRLHKRFLYYWQRFSPDPLLEACRRVYRGPAISKRETLGQYTFALCFDNQILNGWLTEKIFDCFFAGTIPIYLGAPDIETYIPKECFIDLRQFSGYGELRSYLKSLTKKDIRRYKESAREYLRSPQYRPFTKIAFTELIARIVEEDTGIKLLEASV